MHVYHYSAFVSNRELPESINIDGISTMREPISTIDRYRDLKESICREFGLKIDPKKLKIRSLSKIGD